MTIRSTIHAALTQHTDKRMRHAASVYKGGALLAIGINDDKHHAEVNALHAVPWNVKKSGLTVISLRVTANGTLRMAKPCPACQAHMREHGVKTVLYSNQDGQIERMRL